VGGEPRKGRGGEEFSFSNIDADLQAAGARWITNGALHARAFADATDNRQRDPPGSPRH